MHEREQKREMWMIGKGNYDEKGHNILGFFKVTIDLCSNCIHSVCVAKSGDDLFVCRWSHEQNYSV